MKKIKNVNLLIIKNDQKCFLVEIKFKKKKTVFNFIIKKKYIYIYNHREFN